jgi:hypothetical protein
MRDSDNPIEPVLRVLRYRKRPDLERLLQRASMELEESNQYGSRLYSRLTTARIHAHIADYDQLRALNDKDKEFLLEILTEVYPVRDYSPEISSIEFTLDASEVSDVDLLVSELEAQKVVMIAVATGGSRIQEVEKEYKARRTLITQELQKLGFKDTNPFNDLWAWYAKWSSGELPSYRSRRVFISDIFDPLIDRINSGNATKSTAFFTEPTGWAKVDRTLTELRQRLSLANSEEQFQTVGLLCREALISLAQTVFNPKRHPILEDVQVSPTDAKRMLDAYLHVELGGGEYKIARQHARAALDLANELQHKRTATFRQAALCAESTSAVINLVAIISGQRDP